MQFFTIKYYRGDGSFQSEVKRGFENPLNALFWGYLHFPDEAENLIVEWFRPEEKPLYALRGEPEYINVEFHCLPEFLRKEKYQHIHGKEVWTWQRDYRH